MTSMIETASSEKIQPTAQVPPETTIESVSVRQPNVKKPEDPERVKSDGVASATSSKSSQEDKEKEKENSLQDKNKPARKFGQAKPESLKLVEKMMADYTDKKKSIKDFFTQRLDLHLSKIGALENAQKVREKFMKRVEFDFQQFHDKVEERLEIQRYRMRAKIEDYPFLADFREQFEQVKEQEFSGAFHHAPWQVATPFNWDQAFNIYKKPSPDTLDRHRTDYENEQKRRVHEALNGKIIRGPAEIFDQTGSVVFYAHYDGYGFIKSDLGHSYYFHVTRIDHSSRRSTISSIIPRLSDGQRVKFDTFFQKSPFYANNEAVNIRPYGRDLFEEDYKPRNGETIEESKIKIDMGYKYDNADLSFDVDTEQLSY